MLDNITTCKQNDTQQAQCRKLSLIFFKQAQIRSNTNINLVNTFLNMVFRKSETFIAVKSENKLKSYLLKIRKKYFFNFNNLLESHVIKLER